MSSISNLRDAEIRINALEREIEYLKKQVRIANDSGSAGLNAANSSSKMRVGRSSKVVEDDIGVVEQSEFGTNWEPQTLHAEDIQRSADGSTVYHRLKHVFRNLIMAVGNLIPSQDVTYSLGLVNRRWLSVYAQDVHATSVNTANLKLIGGDFKILANSIEYTGLSIPARQVPYAVWGDTAVIQYKGWDGNNYSANIVTAVYAPTENQQFQNGIRV